MTTLKKSIESTDSSLIELRNKLKRNRKEHKSTITALRKELDSLNGRSESAGNQDERLRQRIVQMRQNIEYANNAFAEMSEQTDYLTSLPDQDLQNHDAKKAQWEESQANRNDARESLNEVNKDVGQRQSQLRNDILSVTQKRERLKSRLEKLHEQYERLNAEHSNGQSIKAERDSVRARAAIEQEIKEGQTVSQLESMDRERELLMQKNAAVQTLIRQLQMNFADPRTSTPITPEGVIPNSRNFVPHASTFPLPPMVTSNPGSTYREGREGRGRSSSMLSDVSGLTDHQDAEGGEERLVGLDPTIPYSQPGTLASRSAQAMSPPRSAPPLPHPSL